MPKFYAFSLIYITNSTLDTNSSQGRLVTTANSGSWMFDTIY